MHDCATAETSVEDLATRYASCACITCDKLCDRCRADWEALHDKLNGDLIRNIERLTVVKRNNLSAGDIAQHTWVWFSENPALWLTPNRKGPSRCRNRQKTTVLQWLCGQARNIAKEETSFGTNGVKTLVPGEVVSVADSIDSKRRHRIVTPLEQACQKRDVELGISLVESRFGKPKADLLRLMYACALDFADVAGSAGIPSSTFRDQIKSAFASLGTSFASDKAMFLSRVSRRGAVQASNVLDVYDAHANESAA